VNLRRPSAEKNNSSHSLANNNVSIHSEHGYPVATSHELVDPDTSRLDTMKQDLEKRKKFINNLRVERDKWEQKALDALYALTIIIIFSFLF